MPASAAAPLLKGDTVWIELAGEPIGKARPRARLAHARGKQPWIAFYQPAETVAYEQALAWQGKVAMKGRKPLGGALQVTVTAWMEPPPSWPLIKRARALEGEIRPSVKPDADNILKILDALNEVVWRDDAQIVDARIVKLYGEPRLTIEVTEL